MLSDNQQKNYDYFSEHLGEYLNDQIMKNKFAVFYDEKLQGAYDTFDAAYTFACAQFPVGDFIIQQIIDTSAIVEYRFAS